MDVISDHSQGNGEQPQEPQFDHRIRWGNVALALVALVAIAAAVGLPRGNAADATVDSVAPVTEVVTRPEPTPPTVAVAKPRRERTSKPHRKRSQRKPRPAKSAPARPPARVTPTPAPTPAPAPSAPDPTPAAEREFGL